MGLKRGLMANVDNLQVAVNTLQNQVAVLNAKVPTVYNLASNFPAIAQTTTARVVVTGWSFSVAAGKSYRVEVFGSYQTAALTTGGSIGFVLSGGAVGNIRGVVSMAILQTDSTASFLSKSITAINTVGSTAGSFCTSTGVGVINSPHSFIVELDFSCTTGGIFSVHWGTEVANSRATLLTNSKLIVTAL